jgi:hypothetical protein
MDAAEITALIAEQMAILGGEVVKIGPGLGRLNKEFVEYQKTVSSTPPAAFKEMKSDAEDTLQLIIDMTMAAYDFARALQSASQQGSMMERQMSGMKAGARAGSMFGPIGTLVGGFVGLAAGRLAVGPANLRGDGEAARSGHEEAGRPARPRRHREPRRHHRGPGWADRSELLQ